MEWGKRKMKEGKRDKKKLRKKSKMRKGIKTKRPPEQHQ